MNDCRCKHSQGNHIDGKFNCVAWQCRCLKYETNTLPEGTTDERTSPEGSNE